VSHQEEDDATETTVAAEGHGNHLLCTTGRPLSGIPCVPARKGHQFVRPYQLKFLSYEA